jgi:hypothetical protein
VSAGEQVSTTHVQIRFRMRSQTSHRDFDDFRRETTAHALSRHAISDFARGATNQVTSKGLKPTSFVRVEIRLQFSGKSQ